ncbi:hypothetical protein BDR03DRAFT_645097 [Suillus americanus]|nr:hypothetical protein BDR03DRAFT_645097 [Suillus americanus]
MTAGFGVLPSFVYPWMAGGSLHGYLQREHSNLSAHQKLNILLEIADGIEYLHKKDIVHGNLTGVCFSCSHYLLNILTTFLGQRAP